MPSVVLDNVILAMLRRTKPTRAACFPFSAVKGSGWGANNADAGMENFLVKKSVMIEM